MSEKQKKKPIGRREQREMAVQLVFEMTSQREENERFIQNYFESRELESTSYHYVLAVARTYMEHAEHIEKIIRENIHGWRVERIGKMELNIIRVATVEMLFFEDVPPAVSINEAVEITKRFADEKAYKFVNKVLRNILEADKTVEDIH